MNGEVAQFNQPLGWFELTVADGCVDFWDNDSPLIRLVQPSAVPTTWSRILKSGINPNRRMAPSMMPPRASLSQTSLEKNQGGRR